MIASSNRRRPPSPDPVKKDHPSPWVVFLIIIIVAIVVVANVVATKIGRMVAKGISDPLQNLSETSSLQAESMEQAEEGVARISEVVQSNSATAEEASATSEELSAQAVSMDELVAQFRLRD